MIERVMERTVNQRLYGLLPTWSWCGKMPSSLWTRGATARDLAAELGMHVRSVQRHLAAMERAGLAFRSGGCGIAHLWYRLKPTRQTFYGGVRPCQVDDYAIEG